ncbi:MAG: hypothetical protein H6654_10140 [Ardenticatenaceae bacterium]|nr:hypothetical protein [Anaerolineales bacterium]MCB8938671.1 hypothetical protein [Ardenticatenaceae bacterium]MCB8973907.1 hypothetical protein [Ardenticatenaceae bacterium]
MSLRGGRDGAFNRRVIFHQAGQIHFNVGGADNAIAANRRFIQSHAPILPNPTALAILLFGVIELAGTAVSTPHTHV